MIKYTSLLPGVRPEEQVAVFSRRTTGISASTPDLPPTPINVQTYKHALSSTDVYKACVDQRSDEVTWLPQAGIFVSHGILTPVLIMFSLIEKLPATSISRSSIRSSPCWSPLKS